MRICYQDSLEAVHSGFVPMIIPTERGVVFFTIRPGALFFEHDEGRRMQAHIYMAVEAHKKVDLDEDFPEAEDMEDEDDDYDFA